MGVSTVTAARILKGQLQSQSGEEALLEFDKFPSVGLSKVCLFTKIRAMCDCATRLPG